MDKNICGGENIRERQYKDREKISRGENNMYLLLLLLLLLVDGHHAVGVDHHVVA